MNINIKVDGQRIIIPTNFKHYAKGSKNFVKFIFNFSEDWDSMTISAQFIQDGVGHTRDLTGNYVYLPSELSVGKCILTLRGVSAYGVVGTTNGLSLCIDDNMLIQNIGNEEVDQPLYDRLIKQINGKLDKDPIGMATLEDTQPVHRKPNGELVTKPSGGGSGGVDGVTFTPNVSYEGIISWTNNGGLSNPSPVNIKGKTPIKGVDYFTSFDKESIVNDVLSALPTWKWEAV